MRWYEKYIAAYEVDFEKAPEEAKERVKSRLREMYGAGGEPIVSVVAIAHNEANRLLACLWSLCDNVTDLPIEIMVINNNSTDNTEGVLKELGVRYHNENKKGPGHARNCGLDHAKGMYYLCIDSDTLYPKHYIQTMVDALRERGVVCAYGLWSFLPQEGYSRGSMIVYELLRDSYLRLQNIKRPELNVRGMVAAFRTEEARKERFRTDIIRGEDGSLALALKRHGKLRFVTSRKARPITGYGTVGADGGFGGALKARAIKAMRSFTDLFHSKTHYEDKEDNIIKT